MAQADDPEVPGRKATPPAATSRFWQRYSGRQAGPGEAETGAAEIAAEDQTDTAGPMSGADTAGPASDPGTAEPGGGQGSSGHTRGQTAGRSGHGHTDGHQCLDWCPICRGAELLRAAVPPELQEQFQVVQRDALLLAQAMIEAHLERLKREGPDEDPDISSIPID